jgi:hypothetical protein
MNCWSIQLLGRFDLLARDELTVQVNAMPLASPMQAKKHASSRVASSKTRPINLPKAERLLYLVVKNLADVEAAHMQHSLEQGKKCNPQVSLALYADALRLDYSDVQLWLRFGRAAIAAHAPAVARVALEHGLELHTHHPLLSEELLKLLIQVQLTAGLVYVRRGRRAGLQLTRSSPCRLAMLRVQLHLQEPCLLLIPPTISHKRLSPRPEDS